MAVIIVSAVIVGIIAGGLIGWNITNPSSPWLWAGVLVFIVGLLAILS
jgi:hypothetical protein